MKEKVSMPFKLKNTVFPSGFAYWHWLGLTHYIGFKVEPCAFASGKVVAELKKDMERLFAARFGGLLTALSFILIAFTRISPFIRARRPKAGLVPFAHSENNNHAPYKYIPHRLIARSRIDRFCLRTVAWYTIFSFSRYPDSYHSCQFTYRLNTEPFLHGKPSYWCMEFSSFPFFFH